MYLWAQDKTVQPWGWFYKRKGERRQRSALDTKSECTWTVVRIKGKQLMQIHPQSFLFPYLNGKKELVFRKWLMVVDWAQGLGSFLCPQLGWCSGLSPSFMERPSEVLSNSQYPRDHSTSVFGRLCHRERKGEADAPPSVLDCSPWQAKFSSLFERESEEPCPVFVFIWTYWGAFALKPGRQKAFQSTSETH